jgi:hypothetical protein
MMKDRWAIFWESFTTKRLCHEPQCVSSVTDKLIRFKKSHGGPRQIYKSDLIADFHDEQMAREKLSAARSAFDAEWKALNPDVVAKREAYHQAADDRQKASEKAALSAI